jgi:hypothetical protein
LSAQLGYQMNERWTIGAEVFNLLNRRDSEIDYFYGSRISPDAEPRDDIHFHPVLRLRARAQTRPRGIRTALRRRELWLAAVDGWLRVGAATLLALILRIKID